MMLLVALVVCALIAWFTMLVGLVAFFIRHIDASWLPLLGPVIGLCAMGLIAALVEIVRQWVNQVLHK
jgi:hypothetical protein